MGTISSCGWTWTKSQFVSPPKSDRSPFYPLLVPLHPPRPGTASQPPPVCSEVSSLGWKGEQLPASCPDSWLPPEAGQCREMFAPKQLSCFRNCPTLPRKAHSCSSTRLPPSVWGPETEAGRVGPAEESAEQKGSLDAPDVGGVPGDLSLRTGAFLPAEIRMRALSLPVEHAGARVSIFIWRAAALGSSGPGDNENSTLM